jgi:hypothetical protein
MIDSHGTFYEDATYVNYFIPENVLTNSCEDVVSDTYFLGPTFQRNTWINFDIGCVGVIKKAYVKNGKHGQHENGYGLL